VAARNSIADNLTQVLYPVDQSRKADLLIHLIQRDSMEQVLVFTRSKIGASRLASYLDRRGVSTSAIHGDRSQQERTRALEAFRGRFVKVLVATDVASRGLDIENLPYVVNYELPFEPQDYIHRIGRTGRAGASGTAISLVSPEEVDELRGVQRLCASPFRARSSRSSCPIPTASRRRQHGHGAGELRGPERIGRGLDPAGRPQQHRPMADHNYPPQQGAVDRDAQTQGDLSGSSHGDPAAPQRRAAGRSGLCSLGPSPPSTWRPSTLETTSRLAAE